MKKIDVQNEKNMLDINLIGPEEDILLAYGSTSQKFVGKVWLYYLNREDVEEEDTLIQAHQGKIDFIRLSPSGKLLATASEKGTLIRIWSTETKEKVKELRRGSSARHIKEICFDFSEEIVVVTSNSMYMHIFYLHRANKKSTLSALGLVSSYFGSEWSRLKIKLPEKREAVAIWKSKYKHRFFIFLEGGYSKELALNDNPEEEENTLQMEEFEDIFVENIIS